MKFTPDDTAAGKAALEMGVIPCGPPCTCVCGSTATTALTELDAAIATCLDCSKYNEAKFNAGTMEEADFHSCVSVCCKAGNPTNWIPATSCGPPADMSGAPEYLGAVGHGFQWSDFAKGFEIAGIAFVTEGGSLAPYIEDAAGGKDSGY